MALILQQQVFSWEEVETSSDLDRLRLVLDALDDEDLVVALEQKRGTRGRNDFPIRACFNAVIAGVVFQHPSVESLLRELRRNGELRALCGFEILGGAQAVPSSWAMSRFFSTLIEERAHIDAMFQQLVERLHALLPDFGEHLAFDGKAVASWSTGRTDQKTGKTSDPDAAWGTKTYRGKNREGKAWQKVTRWFGYQLHLIVDSRHELPVAYEVEPANASEATRVAPMVDALASAHAAIIDRCTVLTADRGLDSGPLNKHLLDQYGIKPVIDTRALWRDEKQEQDYDPSREITRALDPKGLDNIIYTERGAIRCVDPVTGAERPMAFRGFEAGRNAVGYRCPAAAYGCSCPGRSQCELAALGRTTDYGRVVRIPLSTDRRVFTPIPRDSPSWKKLYAKRSAVERVNARVDQSFGFERHTIRGLEKMRARMGLALVVMLALAVGHLEHGRPEMIRSLVGSPRKKRAA